jgi:maltooligosyltrehalose synthase
VFAFARRQGERWAVVAVPRLLCRAWLSSTDFPLGREFWQDTRLQVPGLSAGAQLGSPFTGEGVAVGNRDGQPSLALAEVFASFPVALLLA